MEDAAKALLIAAAILMTVMILTLLMIFLNDISSYFTAKHEAQMLEQLTEFNDKFQNYSGQTIRGNELVSIMNRIIDYNNYQADMVGYEKIKIEIDFKSSDLKNELKYDDETGPDLIFKFNGNKITNTSNDESIKAIASLSSDLVSKSGIDGLTDTKLQKMSANIDHIVDDENMSNRDEYIDEYRSYRDQILTRILGAGKAKTYENTVAYKDWISKVKSATYQYYQYTQFKRAMFKCTNVTYNDTNGRVNKMEFEVVTADGKIKFD